MTNKEPDKVTDNRKTHYFRIDNCVIDSGDLSIGAFWLYSALCRYAGTTNKCFPSLRTLASKARAGQAKPGVTEQCIRNWRDELVKKKLIEVAEHEGRNTEYHILDVTPTVTGKPGLRGQRPFTETAQRGKPSLTPPLNSGLQNEDGESVSSASCSTCYAVGEDGLRRQEKEEKKEEEVIGCSSSPKSASLSVEEKDRAPLYSIKTFLTLYPTPPEHPYYSGWKHTSAAEQEWHDAGADQDQAIANRVCTALLAWTESAAWAREDGKAVPSPKKFIRDEDGWYWKSGGPKRRNHKAEVEKVRAYFVEKFDLPEALCALTPERSAAISACYDRALEIDTERAMKVMFNAIDRYAESKHVERHPEMVSIDKVFGQREFERWMNADYQKQQNGG